MRNDGDTRKRGRWHDDAGSASLEFITAGVLLLVPIVYLVVTVAALQAAAFATEGAARFAARIYVESADPRAALEAAERATALSLDDFGVRAEPKVTVTCTPRPDDCTSRGSRVTVAVRVDVPLPLLPSGVAAAARIPVEAESVHRVSTFAVR